MKRNSGNKTVTSAQLIGEHLADWRKIYSIKAEQMAARADISVVTLRKIEQGDPSVSFRAVLDVIRSIGMLGNLESALDPNNSDLGRAKLNEKMPQRVR